MIGTTLSHFKITAKLGEGGMGEVYRAEDTKLGREVAIKVLPEALAQDPERLARFEREAKTLAALDHPNIVHIYSVEEADGTHFLTMQLVEGRPLSDAIPEGGMPLQRIFDIAIPLADALATAHEKGVIHRDLKPANIMVTEERRTKVLDFGIAKLRSELEAAEATELPTEPLTREGRILGTVPYMSPEQLEGKEIDARSDIFSLGVILYELATGQRPFLSIGRDPPPAVDTIRAELPHHLGRVIRRCLENDPERRYQSTKDVRNELVALRKELELESLSTSRAAESTTPPSPKSRRLVTAGGVVAAVLIAVLLALRFGRPKIEEPAIGEPQRIESVAVLPLDNLMNDLEQDYFVEGMHDALIAELAQIDALAVISRQSVLRYRETDKTVPEIAQELGVDAIVEGSVFRAQDTVRITAQLIGAKPTERHLWVESYERDLRDVLALQREVARAIANEIDVALTGPEQARLASTREVEPQAYDYLLRGNQYFNRGLGGPEIVIAVEMYERSVALDPDFSLAWAALSKAYARMDFQRHDAAGESAGKSLAAAQKALELDPDLAEARAALGWYYYWVASDYDRALLEFTSALRDQPNNSDLFLAVGLTKRRQAKWSQALSDLQTSFELDPLSNEKATEVGISHFFARRYEEAAEYFERAIRIAPDHHRAYMYLASTFMAIDHSPDRARRILQQGASIIGREAFARRSIGRNHEDEAIFLAVEEFEEELAAIPSDEFGALEPMYLNYMAEIYRQRGRTEQRRAAAEAALTALRGREPPGLRELPWAHANLGHRDEAIRLAEEAIRHNPISEDARSNPRYLWLAARVFSILGEVDAAVDQLESLFSIPSTFSLGAVACDPTWQPLRDHPRFRALLETHGRAGD